MRFFVPGTPDTGQAELMYIQTRDQLRRRGQHIADRRICRVKFQQDGHPMNVSVGDSFAQDGKPVFAIFETERAFLILTSTYGPPPVDDPVQVPLEHVLDVEDFTALR
jgi:hypothetical protein